MPFSALPIPFLCDVSEHDTVRSEALLGVTLHLLYTQREREEVVEWCHFFLYKAISLIPSISTSTAKLKTEQTVLAKWGALADARAGRLTAASNTGQSFYMPQVRKRQVLSHNATSSRVLVAVLC